MNDDNLATDINDLLDPSLQDTELVVDTDAEASAEMDLDDGGTGDESTSGEADSSGEDGSQPTQSADETVDGDDVTDTGSVSSEGGSAEGGETGDEPIVDDIEAIRQRIAEMSTAAPSVAAPKLDDDGKEIIVNPLDAFKEDVNYITEENLQEIADNPLLLNAAMNNVRRQTAENLMQIVPNLIHTAIQAQALRTEVHNTFYGKHEVLVPYKAYVSQVAKEIAAKMPESTQEEVLEAVARSVKASLKLDVAKPATPTKKQGGKPALRNKAGGGKVTKPANVKASDMQTQIADLLV